MKIAHINNIANVAWILAQAQRRLGHEAVVFSVQESPYQFPSDVRIGGAEGPLGWNAAMTSHWRTLADFDVVHVHGGIWWSQVFYPMFKTRYRWKTLAVHFHGSETRTGKGLHHLASTDIRFHSTPDLGPRIPGSVWIPNPIDLPPLPPEPSNPLPRFGHFPSSPVHKGTHRVIEAFRKAFGPLETETAGHVTRHRGRDTELWVVAQAPHETALRVMAGCDAVIDQLSPFGAYGMVAIEAMAFGKPVLGTLRLDWYAGCPVIPITEGEASEQLRTVANDGDYRRGRGAAGRAYVTRVHEAGAVARQVLRGYYAAQQRPTLDGRQAIAYWQRRGASYPRQVSSPATRDFYARQASELAEILKGLQFHSVAEVGCGFGRIGERLVDRSGVRWVGADLSRNQLMEARRRNPSLRPRLVEASAGALPLRDGAFDLVLGVEVLMHIPPDRIATVLRELWRVSRRYILHLDWYEDYLAGYGSEWSWVHDYPRLWKSLGASPEELRIKVAGLQRAFLVTKPVGSHL